MLYMGNGLIIRTIPFSGWTLTGFQDAPCMEKNDLHEWANKLMGFHVGVSKNRGVSPKMDGENTGKPYFLMDDSGGKPHHLRKHPCTVGTSTVRPIRQLHGVTPRGSVGMSCCPAWSTTPFRSMISSSLGLKVEGAPV